MERFEREGVNRLIIVYAKPNKHEGSQCHIALLNYISSGIFGRIFSQTGIFAGFSLFIIILSEGSAKLRWAERGTLYLIA